MKIDPTCLSEMGRLLAFQLGCGRAPDDGSVTNATVYYVTYVRDLLVAGGQPIPDELVAICGDIGGYLVPTSIAA